MDKKIQATRLLRGLSDVDEKYILEAMGEDALGTAPKKAKVTSLRRYAGIVGAIAAALLLLVAGKALFGTLSSTSSDVAPKVEERNEITDEVNSYMGVDTRSMSAETTMAAAEAVTDGESYNYSIAPEGVGLDEGIEDESLSGGNTDTAMVLSFAEDIDELTEIAGYDFTVPEQVNGSVDCFYISYGSFIEVSYADADGNIICCIRKAEGDTCPANVNACYAETHKVDLGEGYGRVSLDGNGVEFALASWSNDGYSYTVYVNPMMSESDLIDLVLQVN